MTRTIHTLLLLLLAGSLVSTARAQLYGAWHRPVHVEYEQLSSLHFRLVYERGLRREAAEMASLLESSLPEVRATVGLRRQLEIPVVLNQFSDRANGFVTPLPFRQEIEAVELRSKVLSPRFASWFETVGPHELVHAAHAESGRGFGFGWILRRLGPDLARSLNLSGPRGINEGIAVWHESRIRPNAGRLNYPLFTMEFRAAMQSEDPWNLVQMLEPSSYTRPFDRYYHGGAHLFKYMAERDGDVGFFRKARDFYYRFPFLGYAPALWYGTGRSPRRLSRELKRHYRAEVNEFTSNLGTLTEVDVIASEDGAVHRRPTWLDDSTLLVYARGYHSRPGFYRVDATTGERNLVAHEAITEDFAFSLTPDSSAVLFSRYVHDVVEPLRSIAEVHRLDLSAEPASRITHGGRAYGAVATPDGAVWALRRDVQFNDWVSLDADGVMEVVQDFGRTSVVTIAPAPDGRRVVALVNRRGRQGISELVRTSEGWRQEPLVQFADASIYDISWSPDGEVLLLSADPGGVANIYAWEAGTGAVYKLTNVPYGAIEPSLSPDGSTVAFVNYRHERYDLVSVPFDLGSAQRVPNTDLVAAGDPITQARTAPAPVASPDDAVSLEPGPPYVPLLNIRPRVVYPFLLYQRPTGSDDDVHLGYGAGAGLEWSDPLQYWAAHTSAFYQKGAVWGRLMVRSGRFLLRPSLEVFRDPSTVVVRRTRGPRVDTVRVGRADQGIGVGVQSPFVFESNVFETTAFASIVGEYRRERLFGQDGETLLFRGGRFTLRPTLRLGYRMQANPRDIVPNSGLMATGFAAVDVWSEDDSPSRYAQVRSSLYLPFFHETSTGIAVNGELHSQNRGGIVELSRFLPRGHETSTAYLGAGTFVKAGLEVTQPLWYIDDGFFLLPLYFRSVFLYGFVESMREVITGVVSTRGDVERRAVIGGGLGVEMRLAHSVDFTLRIAPVYRVQEGDWSITFR